LPTARGAFNPRPQKRAGDQCQENIHWLRKRGKSRPDIDGLSGSQKRRDEARCPSAKLPRGEIRQDNGSGKKRLICSNGKEQNAGARKWRKQLVQSSH